MPRHPHEQRGSGNCSAALASPGGFYVASMCSAQSSFLGSRAAFPRHFKGKLISLWILLLHLVHQTSTQLDDHVPGHLELMFQRRLLLFRPRPHTTKVLDTSKSLLQLPELYKTSLTCLGAVEALQPPGVGGQAPASLPALPCWDCWPRLALPPAWCQVTGDGSASAS